MRAATIDLGDLADNVAAHLGVLAEEKRQSMVVVRDGRPTCRGDQIVLRQALINLVDNAIKYTPPGGRIEVRVAASDAAAVLEVSDNGPGVADRHAPKLFDRLYRGGERDPSGTGASPVHGNGAGLGLAIARWAVEANRGRLTKLRAGGRLRQRLPHRPAGGRVMRRAVHRWLLLAHRYLGIPLGGHT